MTCTNGYLTGTHMNFRHILGGVIASTALVLAPLSGAFAYEETGEALVVTETNPEPGETFEVAVDAGADSPEATLTVSSDDPAVDDGDIEIAGTQSMTKATTAGVAEFAVTLYVEGTYSLVGTDASGQVVGESTVVVGDGAAGEGDAGGDAGAGASDGGGTSAGVLPDTGSDTATTLLSLGGGLLLLGGAAVLLLSRRRSSQAG